ncbi:hypothetical protein MYX82_11735 [Acidobacteria bacterium AH-259-D05]|nr:hypothetical protein [Acidobacteria bacterium AH-259-D05]
MTDRNKAVFLVLLIFACGILFGGILAFFMVQPRFQGPGRGLSRRPPAARNLPPRAMDELSDGLGLDEGQRRQLRQILRESRENLNEVNREANRRHQAIRLRTQEQIGEILSPEQMEKFEVFLSRRNRSRPGPRQNSRPRRAPLRNNR